MALDFVRPVGPFERWFSLSEEKDSDGDGDNDDSWTRSGEFREERTFRRVPCAFSLASESFARRAIMRYLERLLVRNDRVVALNSLIHVAVQSRHNGTEENPRSNGRRRGKRW